MEFDNNFERENEEVQNEPADENQSFIQIDNIPQNDDEANEEYERNTI